MSILKFGIISLVLYFSNLEYSFGKPIQGPKLENLDPNSRIPLILNQVCTLEGKELQRLFNDAAKYFESIAHKLPPEVLLKFYARYKQAREGPCNIEKPGFFNFQAKEKWQAWKSLENMSKEFAMKEYIAKLNEIDPEWTGKNLTENR